MSILKRIQGENSPQPANQNNNSGLPTSSAAPLHRMTPPSSSANQDTYQDLKNRVQNKLLSTLDGNIDLTNLAEVRKTIQNLLEQILLPLKVGEGT